MVAIFYNKKYIVTAFLAIFIELFNGFYGI